MENKKYIGFGVHAEIAGGMIKLTVVGAIGENLHIVYLDTDSYTNLVEFVNAFTRIAESGK